MIINNHRTLNILLMVCLVIQASCTTLKEVGSVDVPLDQILKTGDRIVVYEKTGRVIDMRYVLLGNGEIRGSLTENGLKAVEVRIDQIEKIEAERIGAGRTTVAVIGGIVFLPIVALGAGIGMADP